MAWLAWKPQCKVWDNLFVLGLLTRDFEPTNLNKLIQTRKLVYLQALSFTNVYLFNWVGLNYILFELGLFADHLTNLFGAQSLKRSSIFPSFQPNSEKREFLFDF